MLDIKHYGLKYICTYIVREKKILQIALFQTIKHIQDFSTTVIIAFHFILVGT